MVGLAAYGMILGGTAIVLADLQHLAPGFLDPGVKFSEMVKTQSWLIHGLTHILGTTLLLAALPGLVLLHGPRLGGFGRTTALLAFLLVSAYLGVSYVMTLGTRDVPAEVLDRPASGPLGAAFASYPLSALTLTLFGIALARAKLLPRAATILFAAGAILTPISEVLAQLVWLPMTGAALFGAGLAWMGVASHRIVQASDAQDASKTRRGEPATSS